jgi:hypothetical protein
VAQLRLHPGVRQHPPGHERALPAGLSDRRAGRGIQFHAEVRLGDFEHWIDHHRDHPEDGDGPDDPEELRTRTRALMPGWNALGRALFARFLDQATLARGGTVTR